jgi:hypothetical protein
VSGESNPYVSFWSPPNAPITTPFGLLVVAVGPAVMVVDPDPVFVSYWSSVSVPAYSQTMAAMPEFDGLTRADVTTVDPDATPDA